MREPYDHILYAWSIDFLRAVEELPTWRKWIIRFALGKYAAREYVGLREHLDSHTFHNSSQLGYGLEGCMYHKERWKWIKDR